jgi:hypothetical protein
MHATFERYRESRIGRSHVHAARFVALFAVITLTWSLPVYLAIEHGGGVITGAGLPEPVAVAFIGALGAWLPAALLTAAWAGGDD